MGLALSPGTVSYKKQQADGRWWAICREAALRTLAHHMDVEWLRRPTGAPGGRGCGGEWSDGPGYAAEHLEANLQSLLKGPGRRPPEAPAVRRVFIPKADGTQLRSSPSRTRSRGAVVMLLEPLYEQDFLDCSYGFRPGRSAHQALEAHLAPDVAMGGGVALGRGYPAVAAALDTARRLQAAGLQGSVVRSVAEPGVLGQGCITHPETGTPQGRVISPAGQHLPPRGAGRVVRTGGEAPAAGVRQLPGALCGRLRHGLRPGGGYPAGVGGASRSASRSSA